MRPASGILKPVKIHEAVNHQFTYEYSQPADYHFCQDSIIFPQFVAENVKDKIDAESKVLDLCAGCGVIGFELQHHLPVLRRMDFLEIQAEFKSHFERNRTLTGRSEFRFLEMNYANLLKSEFANTYDLIVCNPPYFFAGDGRPSPSEIKNRARFFLDESFENLILGVENALKPGGTAYLLVKSGSRHGRDSWLEIKSLLGSQAQGDLLADIRGTGVIRISKPA